MIMAMADITDNIGTFEPIAIVGVGAILPDAPDVIAFWNNVISGKSSIRVVPENRWRPGDHWVEGGPKNVPEGKTYSKIGAWVEGYEFDWRKWKIPPGSLPQIDTSQQWAVSVSYAALEDAGYLGDNAVSELPRESTGVVFANALGGENRTRSTERVLIDRYERHAREVGISDEDFTNFKTAILRDAPRVNEDTMPGELANVVAGRVANILDLNGPNYTTDAACASAMAAVMDACHLLHSRQVSMMIAGASDRSMDPATYAKFSAIGALSANHSVPFDSRADGFVMGEGAGALVLKRLDDAIADGDKIYSVIRGIGASSDGRGKGITAPSQNGQVRAISRAYDQAGYQSTTVELIEAHGTSTSVGDATELSSLSEIYGTSLQPGSVAVGSIKSQIGHLKAAAGLAGLLKASLSLFNRTIPPSSGFVHPNQTVPWSEVPFYVPTKASEWPDPEFNPRRAGVSAFGFGGTNFHIALEQYHPEIHSKLINSWNSRLNPELVKKPKPALSWEHLKALEGGVLLLNAETEEALIEKLRKTSASLIDGSPNFDESPTGKRLSKSLPNASKHYTAKGIRLAIVATSWAQLEKRIALAEQGITNAGSRDFLASQQILIRENPVDEGSKLAHMYPGQGSQYLGMTLDLAQRYPVVASTWKEADEIMTHIIEEPLSRIVFNSSPSGGEQHAAQIKLTQTEFTQPAMLTADLAINRLLSVHGIQPDMVAGHSLGEYAALMVSGILSFEDAMRAAAARGTEMGAVDVPDKGLMAAVGAPAETVEKLLGTVDGYVIAANRNSPKSTVIAGETKAVQDAMKILSEEGASVIQLQTSHAFHTDIVSPANEPLKRFLNSIELSQPKIPITANVDGSFYPMDSENPQQSVLEKLAPQMSSPVNWIDQIETMRGSGAKIFLEVGPKRALTTTIKDILGDDVETSATNHPKTGGIATFLGSIAFLAINGKKPIIDEWNSGMLSAEFTSMPSDIDLRKETLRLEQLRTRSRPLPKGVSHSANELERKHEIVKPSSSENQTSQYLAEITGYPASVLSGRIALEELGVGMSDIDSIIEKIGGNRRFDEQDRRSMKTVEDLASFLDPDPSLDITEEVKLTPPVVSGVSLGVPGMEEVFDENVWEAIFEGRNLISEIPDEMKKKLVDQKIVRLVKSEDGTSRLVPANSFETVPQLAGVGGRFDLADQYGVDKKLVEAFDIATSLAFASGIEALRDAGLPLFPVEQKNSSGLRVIRGWNLPEREKDRTGVIFASVFPGLEKAIEHAFARQSSEYTQFDRKYLLQVLSMGHSQFASWIGARGPNLAINNACASTPAAFAIAEDWMARGRCDRVIIVSGDDSTSDSLMPWIGAGFASAGAHAMGNSVEDVALPFDARRHGMLLGMGGAGFVLERMEDAIDRGVVPYVEVLGAEIANSAYHPTRLDTEHAASVMDSFITKMERKWSLDREKMANRMTFMSHEPYTPPRGGSASAEVTALRQVFGKKASKILITNAKGYTGHPMGVGLEDAVVIRCLSAGVFPPVANYRVEDPTLGELNISKGGPQDLDLALRHGAGFGSQIALTLLRRVSTSDKHRFEPEKISKWSLRSVSGNKVELRVLKRKLVAYVDVDDDLVGGISGDLYDPPPIKKKSPSSPKENLKEEPAKVQENRTNLTSNDKNETQATAISTPANDTIRDVNTTILSIVSAATGYPKEFIETDADMEGELGIDSIKQAEIMAEIREVFGLPEDESFQLMDYPTISHVEKYIRSFTGETHSSKKEILLDDRSETIDESNTLAEDFSKTSDSSAALKDILPIVAAHTGYPEEFLEADADMEGELGIDSIKQAEIMTEIRSIFNLELDEEFQIRDYPTLGQVANYVAGYQKSTNAPETFNPADEAVGSEDVTIHRHTISTEIMGPLKMGEIPPVVFLTQDEHGISGVIAEKLTNLGSKPEVIDENYLFEAKHKDACVIYLSGVSSTNDLQSDPDPLSWTVETYRLLKKLDALPSGSIKKIVTVTSMDGAHGFNGGTYNSSVAGIHGAVMSYGRERNNVDIRAIDVDPTLLGNMDELAESILREVTRISGPIEVGISSEFERRRITLERKQSPETIRDLSDEGAWLVSGGAAGVTSECVIQLAQANQKSSPTFVLLGRTPLDPDLEPLVRASDEELEQEKIKIKQFMDEQHENGRVSLKEWNAAWENRKRGIGIHKTLARIKSTGAECDYISVDVTSESEVEEMVSKVIQRYGKITGLIHGAGIEDSTPFESKSEEVVNRVLDVKVGGFRNLQRYISKMKQSLNLACSFTSVAGRLGNATQLDYCAANRILDAEHSRIRNGEIASFSIAWAPWSGIGMATKGSLETVFARSGVDMIPLDVGASMFVQEVMGSGEDSTLISGKLGILDNRSSVRMPGITLSTPFSSDFGTPGYYPMIDNITSCQLGHRATTSVVLSTDRHSYLLDHSISGIPYLPGVMALEMMAETVLACENEPFSIHSFDDVNFLIPVKLTRSEKEIICTVERLENSDEHIYACRIESISPIGKGEVLLHHSAIITLRDSNSKSIVEDIIPTDEDGSRVLGSGEIYHRMFHGPMFQPLMGVVASIQNRNGKGIEARVHALKNLPNPYLFNIHGEGVIPTMKSHPLLVESCFQAAGLTSMDLDLTDSLPVGADRITISDDDISGSITVASLRLEAKDTTSYHETVVRVDGSPVIRIEGLRMRAMGEISSGQRPNLIDRDEL